MSDEAITMLPPFMLITLEPNRSNPKRFVAITTYERRGDVVVPVRRVYDGPGHCISTKELAWPTGGKDWAPVYTGKRGDGNKGRHNKPYTIKRDWLQLHQELELIREEETI
jgi:hypothetical protein